MDRGAGSVVNLHVGTHADPAAYGGEYSSEYASEVRKRPDISTEGDGLKAAAGLFLNILAIPKSIYLIDEPDVYLHPPQAYATAREMVNISNGKQLFMATHNAHFLRGLLDSNSERVVLVRLDRSTDIQSVKVSRPSRGLSPRVRGNPRQGGRRNEFPGSIPARAGEPGSGRHVAEVNGVYPRACGGTLVAIVGLIVGLFAVQGLSPRVRGNHHREIAEALTEGSIPARAGEPRSPSPSGAQRGVYPRACGGTGDRGDVNRCPWGLSPRVRGNQRSFVRLDDIGGSIPARAGEPRNT